MIDDDEVNKVAKVELNNGVFRNPKKLVEEMNELLPQLSSMQRDFCHAMMTAQSAKAAAITAGYSPNSAASKASQLLVIPAVQRYMGLLGLLRSQAVVLDTKEVVSLQLSLYYKAVEKDDLQQANKALDQLAKMTGSYGGADSRNTPSPKEIAELDQEAKEDVTETMLELLKVVDTRG